MLSIVVPAYNEEGSISKCLASLPHGGDILTVVGGSDRTAEVAAQYGRVVLDTSNAGAGAARNMGAREAIGEVILFTDADTVVPADWAAGYESIFRDPTVVAAGGAVRPMDGGLLDHIVFKINQDWLYRLTAVFGFYQLSGNNCAYRRSAFLAVGGFDGEMGFLEDTELPMRIKRLGKVVFAPGVRVMTSPRRMRRAGYLRLWVKFVSAYLGWFLLGKKPRRGYFASAESSSSP